MPCGLLFLTNRKLCGRATIAAFEFHRLPNHFDLLKGTNAIPLPCRMNFSTNGVGMLYGGFIQTDPRHRCFRASSSMVKYRLAGTQGTPSDGAHTSIANLIPMASNKWGGGENLV